MTIAEQGASRKEELVLRHGYRPKRLKSKQLYILQGLPHVGPVLAQRLLKHFGSVKEVICASEDDFQMVEGIGNGLAKKIAAVLK